MIVTQKMTMEEYDQFTRSKLPNKIPQNDHADPRRWYGHSIYDFSTPQLVFGRVALVGDAASSARPHMGFGMAKAGGDAQALAEALAGHDDIDAGLAAYNKARQPIGERIMLHGRKLGTHLGVNLQTDEDRAMWTLLQDHCAMMDWIAVPNFLAASR